MVIGLGCFALVVGMSYALLVTVRDDTSSPSTHVYDYGPKGSPFIGHGTADHRAPHEVAIAVSSTEAMKANMGQGLTNLPTKRSRSERERT